jgi:hypothetical protein
MTSNHDPADWAPIHILPPLAFDLSSAAPAGPFGKSDAPVTILPPVPFDLSERDEVPVLRLTLHLRPGAEPAQLALDVLGLIDALNRYERELGGRGVTWDKAHSRAEPEQGVVHLVLAPNEPRHARERLARLAATAADPTAPATLANNGQSFGRWEVTVGNDAA